MEIRKYWLLYLITIAYSCLFVITIYDEFINHKSIIYPTQRDNIVLSTESELLKNQLKENLILCDSLNVKLDSLICHLSEIEKHQTKK